MERLRRAWRRLLDGDDRVDALADTLKTRLAELEEALKTRVAGVEDSLKTRLAGLEARLDAVGVALDVAQDERRAEVVRIGRDLRHLNLQLDLLKSSLELDSSLPDEFARWKAENPVPARPLVSVCVATFDRADTLVSRCIPSVLQQTYDHLELIVVGDGCTDGTSEAVSLIHDSRLRFLNLPERGHYPDDPMRRWMVAGTAPLNKALSLVSGDFVTHLDDDDEYLPTRLEELVDFAVSHRCDVVWHPFWCEDARGGWAVNQAREFALAQVTTSSVFYRSWLARIPWNAEAHRLYEPGDWNRFRKFLYLGPVAMRYPDPLLRHYREGRPA